LPTVRVIEAVRAVVAESVALAVMTCVPFDNFFVRLEPVPRRPSRSEVHRIELDRSPSSASLASPWNTTSSPDVKEAFAAGAPMAIVGGVLATAMVTVAVLDPPSESVTLAVIVCEPGERRLVNSPPVPIGPSMFDVQVIWAVRLPSSKSLADPLKWMSSLD
jgi:hypothetical protein